MICILHRACVFASILASAWVLAEGLWILVEPRLELLQIFVYGLHLILG